jgi:uncharacterized SAM-binding protein YcdF (DUF218 family)
MPHLSDIVKQWLIPGSFPFLLAGSTAGVTLLYAGGAAAAIGRVWLTMLVLLYWVLSLPAVCNALIAGLASTSISPRPSGRVHAVVAFGNGNVHYTDGLNRVDYLTRRSVFCVFETARLYDIHRPARVITSGGVAGHPDARPEAVLMRDLLVTCGVPSAAITMECRSRNTSEQVSNVVALLREDSQLAATSSVVVVTTPAHSARLLRLFAMHQMPVVPAVMPELRYDEKRSGWNRWLPSMSALTGSASATYEYLANVRERLAASPR